jgi:hypothetical protein
LAPFLTGRPAIQELKKRWQSCKVVQTYRDEQGPTLYLIAPERMRTFVGQEGVILTNGAASGAARVDELFKVTKVLDARHLVARADRQRPIVLREVVCLINPERK